MIIYPFIFVDDCLSGNAQVTIELAFNMLDAGTIPQLPTNGYEDIMASVHHIVPRD